MALEYWEACAVRQGGERMGKAALVYDTRQRKVVDTYMEEYYVSKESYGAWRGCMPLLEVERAWG